MQNSFFSVAEPFSMVRKEDVGAVVFVLRDPMWKKSARIPLTRNVLLVWKDRFWTVSRTIVNHAVRVCWTKSP